MRLLLLSCVLFASLLALGSCNPHQRLLDEQENVAKQTEVSRIAAEKEAKDWEAHIQKLNAEVLPDDHYSHEVKHSKVTKQPASHGAHVKTVTPKHVAKPHITHKAEHEAAAYLKHLDHLSNEALPHSVKSSPKWHTETAEQLLDHDRQVAAAANPVEPKEETSAFHESAASMFARRAAEVAAAFPASWSAAVKPTTAQPAKKAAAKSTWAQRAAFRQAQLQKYQSDRAKDKLVMSEMQIKVEHAQAEKQGAKELNHLSKISDEVWPSHHAAKSKVVKAVAKPGPATKKVAAPHAPQQPVHDWRAGRVGSGHANKKMPKSSDSPVPNAGTDQVYLGAHQAGYARKPPAKVAHAAPVSAKARSAASVQAKHQAHRHIAAAVAAADSVSHKSGATGEADHGASTH